MIYSSIGSSSVESRTRVRKPDNLIKAAMDACLGKENLPNSFIFFQAFYRQTNFNDVSELEMLLKAALYYAHRANLLFFWHIWELS